MTNFENPKSISSPSRGGHQLFSLVFASDSALSSLPCNRLAVLRDCMADVEVSGRMATELHLRAKDTSLLH